MTSEPKKDPIAKLAHDINNPLASSKLLLDMLINGVAGELNDQQKDMLKDINEANDKIIEIIKEFRNKQ
jgi:signal transduction histidine kinase